LRPIFLPALTACSADRAQRTSRRASRSVLALAAVSVCACSLAWSQVPAATQADEFSLSLAAAERLLVQHSPVVAAARAAAAVAASETARVDVAPNPTLQAALSNTRAGRYPYGASDRLLRLEQLVERGGKRDLRVGLAVGLADAARLEAADQLRQQFALLGSAHADLAAAQQLEELALENRAAWDRLVQAGTLRVAAGDLAPADQLRLELEAQRAAVDYRSASAARAQGRGALAALIGLRDPALLLRAVEGLPDEAAIMQTFAELERDRPLALSVGLDDRPDVRAAERRLVAAERAFTLAASLRVRDVTVGMQLERAPDFGGTVVGVSLGVPLLVNNDYRGELLRAQADIELARTGLARSRVAALAEAQAAWVRLSAASDRAARLLRESLPRAESVAAMVEAGFAQGGASINDLFDTRRQLIAARVEAVQARAEFARALAQWRGALSSADGEPGVQASRGRRP
jgi:cobalt-zinc-cadmium efflux system outer membrane protein